MEHTLQQYDRIIAHCRSLVIKKTKDYGTAWRILRPTSLTDQLYIKAKRIRSIEEKGTQKIEESVDNEYVGLINYSALALIQLQLEADSSLDLSLEEVTQWYDQEIEATRSLMIAKNHDYGEVWREMRTSSLTDLILMKLLRIKQIEDNAGLTLASEGIDAGYRDIINYAIFALIQLNSQILGPDSNREIEE